MSMWEGCEYVLISILAMPNGINVKAHSTLSIILAAIMVCGLSECAYGGCFD